MTSSWIDAVECSCGQLGAIARGHVLIRKCSIKRVKGCEFVHPHPEHPCGRVVGMKVTHGELDLTKPQVIDYVEE
jgi:hypothetical protein